MLFYQIIMRLTTNIYIRNSQIIFLFIYFKINIRLNKFNFIKFGIIKLARSLNFTPFLLFLCYKRIFYYITYIYLKYKMIKAFILTALITVSLSINYPLYKQCDAKWANQRLGTSSNTICSAGCLMSSAAMALYGVGNTQFNPSSLNQWLTNNNGYVSKDLFVWASINRWGVTFKGFISNDQIRSHLDGGNIVILNVHNGGHWVLATGYSGDAIQVNDPGYAVSSYKLSQIVNGNTGVYTINKLPNFINNWLISLGEFLSWATLSTQQPQSPPVKVIHESHNIVQE